ncbi:MAG TPA: hypothetical protein VNF71_14765 [Acidimicrobiales bacterium]|nr:hypothetical protein [Acidimicrobiales bacterium]
MPSLLLGGRWGNDPVGERALLAAFAASLPEYEVVSGVTALSRAVSSDAVRQLRGMVVAGEELAPLAFERRPRSGMSLGAATRLMSLSRALRKPLTFLGVSVGAANSALDRTLARHLVRRAVLLLVADEESAGSLASAGAAVPVRVSADPAWLGFGPGGAVRGGGETVTVVVDGRVRPDIEVGLLSGLAAAAGQGMRIKLLPWAGHDSPDRAMSFRLAEQLRNQGCAVETAPSPVTLDDACHTFEDAGVVVTLRYRAVHAAASLGVPIVGVGTEARITAMARRLEQTSIAPGSLAAALPSAIVAAFNGPAPSPAAVKDEIARADAGFSLMRLVLERGDTEISQVDGLPLAPDPWLR